MNIHFVHLTPRSGTIILICHWEPPILNNYCTLIDQVIYFFIMNIDLSNNEI